MTVKRNNMKRGCVVLAICLSPLFVPQTAFAEQCFADFISCVERTGDELACAPDYRSCKSDSLEKINPTDISGLAPKGDSENQPQGKFRALRQSTLSCADGRKITFSTQKMGQDIFRVVNDTNGSAITGRLADKPDRGLTWAISALDTAEFLCGENLAEHSVLREFTGFLRESIQSKHDERCEKNADADGFCTLERTGRGAIGKRG